VQPVAVNYRGTDVGDDELRVGDEWVAQKWEYSLHTTAGHECEMDLRVVAEQAIEREPVGLTTAEEGSVEISCQK
jgi:hypothetical protein